MTTIMSFYSGSARKSFFIALSMAMGLFIYGYFLPKCDDQIAQFLNFLPFKFPVPFHPIVVHFPVALFISAVLFELVGLIFHKESLQKTAFQLYIFATLITPWIVVTGLLEADRLNLHHPLLEAHQKFAFLTMWVSLMSLPVVWVIRREFTKYFPVIFLVVLIVTAGGVILTGDRGGHMVYEYGVGMRN